MINIRLELSRRAPKAAFEPNRASSFRSPLGFEAGMALENHLKHLDFLDFMVLKDKGICPVTTAILLCHISWWDNMAFSPLAGR